MVWEWSYSEEGTAAAKANVFNAPDEWLVDAYIEWLDYKGIAGESDPQVIAENEPVETFAEAWSALRVRMAETIWQYASEQRKCSNGGHDLYMCPHGCHTVPPHVLPDADEEEED